MNAEIAALIAEFRIAPQSAVNTENSGTWMALRIAMPMATRMAFRALFRKSFGTSEFSLLFIVVVFYTTFNLSLLGRERMLFHPAYTKAPQQLLQQYFHSLSYVHPV